MKFICNKEELAKAINIVIRTAYSKYQKSILECIHIVARDGGISLDTFDTTTAMKTTLYADVLESGQTAIPARIFYDIISKFPSGEIHFEREGSTILLTGENSRASLQEMDAEQFPAFPALEGESCAWAERCCGRWWRKRRFPSIRGRISRSSPAFCLRQTQRSKASALWASMESAWQKIPLLPRARRKFAR